MTIQQLNGIKENRSKKPDSVHATEGNLLIPDMTGFTKFVQVTDMETGRYIVSRLLTVLLESNVLDLNVSEIEGDAILFYKLGRRLSRKEVLTQFGEMQRLFHKELLSLSKETAIKIDLGLKLIAHYGPLSEYQIGRFTKLYGTSVIEAHRLLKNSINSDEYVIMTDTLLDNKPAGKARTYFGNRVCENYNQLESICFTWLGYPQLITALAQ
jgi:hypothetical protein